MALSNIIGLFIVLTTAATLHAHGHTNIQTSSEAAEALRPIAGFLAFAIFAAGIVGTGMLSVPVLAGSAAFVVCGVFNKKDGLAKRPKEAPVFYGVVAGILALAIALNLIHIDPIKALFWSAVINALAALPVMTLIMLLSSRRKIMHDFLLPPVIGFLGWAATIFMILVCTAMFWTWAV